MPEPPATAVPLLDIRGLLSRLDGPDLLTILGQKAARLMAATEKQAFAPSKLLDAISHVRSPADLLASTPTRNLLFDALRTDEALELCRRLHLNPDTQGPHARLKARSFRNGSRETERLWAAFGVTRLKPERVDAPGTTAVVPTYGLFGHQRTAIRNVKLHLQERSSRVLLHMPTGAGKTRVAMSVVCDHLIEQGPSTVIWLAYSEELCEQAASEFQRAWASRGDREVTVHRAWGDFDPTQATSDDGLLVAGLAKMHATLQRNLRAGLRLRRNATLMVFDEAHQAVAPTFRGVIEDLLNPGLGTRLLGLSATPGRSWDRIDEDEVLAGFFRRNKVTLEVPGFGNPVDYLIAEGYLARPAFEPLLYSGEPLAPQESAAVAAALDIPAETLERLAGDELRNARILARVLDLARDHQRILLFASTVEHAEMLATVLSARGIRALCVSSRSTPQHRAATMAAYLNGSPEPTVLCNYGILTTGFDAPRTSAVVIARPTKSLVLFSQMVGRALRGPRAGGNPSALVVTVIDPGLPGFGEVGEAFLNWEDVW